MKILLQVNDDLDLDAVFASLRLQLDDIEVQPIRNREYILISRSPLILSAITFTMDVHNLDGTVSVLEEGVRK